MNTFLVSFFGYFSYQSEIVWSQWFQIILKPKFWGILFFFFKNQVKQIIPKYVRSKKKKKLFYVKKIKSNYFVNLKQKMVVKY